MKNKILLSFCSCFALALGAAQLKVHFDFNELQNNRFVDKVAGITADGPSGVDLSKYAVDAPNGKGFLLVPGKNPLTIKNGAWVDLKNDFTIEIVFRSDKNGGFRCLFWKGDRSKKPEIVNFHVGLSGSRLEFKAKDAQGKWVIRHCYAYAPEGSWNRLLVHWKDGKLKASLNNQMVKVGELNEGTLKNSLISSATDCHLGQGADGGTPSYFFIGAIDELKIWQGDAVSLRDREWNRKVKALKLREAAREAKQLALHFDFNELQNNEFVDKVSGVRAVGAEGVDLSKFQTVGPYGKAYRFEAGKNPLNLKHVPAIDLKNDFTIDVVFKAAATSDYRCLFWKGDRSKKPEIVNYYFGIRSDRPEFKAKDPNGNWVVRTGIVKLNHDQWYHMLIHFKNGEVKMVLDGKPLRVGRVNDGRITGELVSAETEFFFGQGASNKRPNAFFAGEVDDVKIWRGDMTHRTEIGWEKAKKLLPKRIEEDAELQKKNTAAEKNILDRKVLNACHGKSFGFAFLPTAWRMINIRQLFAMPLVKDAAMELAGNESESLQLYLFNAPGKENIIKSVTVPELRSAAGTVLPASAVSVGSVGMVTTEAPDIPVEFTGDIPDVIFTGDSAGKIPADGMKTLVIRVTSGKVPAGTYRGDIVIDTDSGTHKIPLTVTIRNFVLPERATLRNAFCFFDKYYREWYKLDEIPRERRLQIYDFLLSYRINPCNIYEAAYDTPRVEDLDAVASRINFMVFQNVRYRKSMQFQVEHCKNVSESVKKYNLSDYIYYYSYDELSCRKSEYPAARKNLDMLRKELPELKCMQTSYPDEGLRDIFNVWCPVWDNFSDPVKYQTMGELKKQGHEIWWYSADDPHKPYPNFFLDYPVFDCRIISTLSYMYQVKGILYWCINREWATNMDIKETWPDKPWKPWIYKGSSRSHTAKNGMGNFVYPGKDGTLLPSLRLENLRDGIEDYEYLAILERESAKLPAGSPLRSEARRLLNVPPQVAKSLTEYSADPQHLLVYRRQLADMIEKIMAEIQSKRLK
ncbi:MAG: DUF4091 domain-containing protein [Lentisphaerae bacterium]|nr:DUF4091 domain-containing protein [Lentisphaerota bacterium]